MVEIIVPILLMIVRGLFWGFVTQVIIDNKGRSENWFWWGFFFGIIAVLVAALSKPAIQPDDYYSMGFMSEYRDKAYANNVIEDGGWRCHFCNRANPSYTGTCACGRTKTETLNIESAIKEQIKKQEREEDSLDKLKKLKELLDCGALTQEEFDEKKKELLKETL